MNPSGLGIYIRNLRHKSHGTPLYAAAHARQHRVSWVAIGCVWQDGLGHRLINPPQRIAEYARAFASAGIGVWLWGYPRAGREAEFVQAMSAATAACESVNAPTIRGWLLDPEAGYKWGLRFGRREKFARQKALELVAMCRVAQPSMPIGCTSFGLISAHRNFPWAEFAAGTDYGSPQTYTLDDARVRKAMAEWRALWRWVVPSTPGYGPNTMRLDAYLAAHGNPPGVCVWSWQQLAPREWTEYALAFRR